MSSWILLALLVPGVVALKCWQMTKEFDYNHPKDKGLIECPPEQSNFCLYTSVTAFMPRDRSRYPVPFETVRCSSGRTYDEKNAEKYINLTQEDLCNGKLHLPHKWIYTHLPKSGEAYQLVERLNDVRCCTTDGCNNEEYRMIGGGTVNKTSWYKRSYNWLKDTIF